MIRPYGRAGGLDQCKEAGKFVAIRLGNRKMANTIYGIKNCDTMKKARAWLDAKGVAYAFHDYKTAGVEKDRLKGWSDKLGWEILLNRAGTTFKKLPDADKEGITEKKALALMLAQPSMIKRPVLELGGKLLVGFKPEIYAEGSRQGQEGLEKRLHELALLGWRRCDFVPRHA